jgi:3-keto-disaccharide hydrolase
MSAVRSSLKIPARPSRNHALRMVMAGMLVVAGLEAADLNLDWNASKLNAAPPDFTSTAGGDGKPGDWKIILDEAPPLSEPITPNPSARFQIPVLAQLSRDRTDEHFPMLIYDKETFGDFTASVRFKLVGGETEQMAGLAFRYQDEKNYYYIRASGLSGTLYFFKTVNSVRSRPIGVRIEVPKGVWHQLTVECRGDNIRGLFNGKETIPELHDSSFTGGKIGLWTKSDAVTYFRDLHIQYTPKVSLAQLAVQETLVRFDRLLGLKIVAAQGENKKPTIVASESAEEIGQSGRPEETDVMRRGVIYQAKGKGTYTLSMPLRDRNGDPMAAVRVIMKRFPGQTEKNAITRALPVVKSIEERVHGPRDLLY